MCRKTAPFSLFPPPNTAVCYPTPQVFIDCSNFVSLPASRTVALATPTTALAGLSRQHTHGPRGHTDTTTLGPGEYRHIAQRCTLHRDTGQRIGWAKIQDETSPSTFPKLASWQNFGQHSLIKFWRTGQVFVKVSGRCSHHARPRR